jgi:hypothetical protein
MANEYGNPLIKIIPATDMYQYTFCVHRVPGLKEWVARFVMQHIFKSASNGLTSIKFIERKVDDEYIVYCAFEREFSPGNYGTVYLDQPDKLVPLSNRGGYRLADVGAILTENKYKVDVQVEKSDELIVTWATDETREFCRINKELAEKADKDGMREWLKNGMMDAFIQSVKDLAKLNGGKTVVNIRTKYILNDMVAAFGYHYSLLSYNNSIPHMWLYYLQKEYGYRMLPNPSTTKEGDTVYHIEYITPENEMESVKSINQADSKVNETIEEFKARILNELNKK